MLNFTNESDNVLIMCVSLQNRPLNKSYDKDRGRRACSLDARQRCDGSVGGTHAEWQ